MKKHVRWLSWLLLVAMIASLGFTAAFAEETEPEVTPDDQYAAIADAILEEISEAPAEEQTPAEEAPAEEAPVEEAPAEEAPAEEAPAEEAPAEEAPAEEAPVLEMVDIDLAAPDAAIASVDEQLDGEPEAVNAIVDQPQPITVAAGDDAVFSVGISGEWDSCQWQYSKNGRKWYNMNARLYGGGDTLSFMAERYDNGYLFRVVVAFADGTKETSDAAALTVVDPYITEQPASVTAAPGTTATFKVGVAGAVSMVRWQVSKNGGRSWSYLSTWAYGASDTLNYKAVDSADGYMFRAYIVCLNGAKLVSDAATLSVGEPAIETSFETKLDGVTVSVETDDGAFDEPVKFEVVPVAAGSDAYDAAENALAAYNCAYDGMIAIDMHFSSLATGAEVEPNSPVHVSLSLSGGELSAIPADAADTLVLYHIADDGKVEIAAQPGLRSAALLVNDNGESITSLSADVTVGSMATAVNEMDVLESIDAEFDTGVFSTFTITWGSGSSSTSTNTTLQFRRNRGELTNGNITVNYVDENGESIIRPNGIADPVSYTLSDGSSQSVNIATTLGLTISGCEYVRAYYKDGSGTKHEITSVNGQRNDSTAIITLYNGNTIVYNGNPTNIYLEYSGTPSGGGDTNVVTVHYVDENGNELTIKNPNNTHPNLDGSSSSPAFLIYDIEGYEYSYTYRNNDSSRIAPLLTKTNGQNPRWQYMSASSTTTSNLEYGDDIYVVYKAKPAVPTGGTAQVDLSGETWPDDTPQYGKSSTRNSDGVTNTIALTIAAPEKKVEKNVPADVIVVFDVSGSMSNNLSGSTTRLSAAKTAVKTMADTLMGSNSQVRMALISFSTDAATVRTFTDNVNTFKSDVDGLSANGGTNWEKALKLANEMQVRSDAATFVVFVTDGDPTFRVSRGDVTNGNMDNYNSNTTYQYYRLNQVFGEGNNDSQGRNFDYAVLQVAAIKNASKSFYAIGVSNDVTKVRTLCSDAGVDTSHAFIATDTASMDTAFNSITESIKSFLGYGDVAMADGITELSNTRMEMLHEVDENSFKYYRIDSTGEHEWTTREADGCGAASYNEETGTVEWKMGSFQLEDGVTYKVTFKVWPSQDAYDLIAELNNGTKTYAELTDEQKAQVHEYDTEPYYRLKTNVDGSVTATYKKTTKTGETVSIADNTPIPVDEVHIGTMEEMPLESMQLSLQKVFTDTLTAAEDRLDKVEVRLQRRAKVAEGETPNAFQDYPVYQAGSTTPSALITLNEDNNWTYTFYVSPGLEADGEILEKGYEFTLSEETTEYHYELNGEIINPMIIDGTDTFVGDGYVDLDGDGVIDDTVVSRLIDGKLTAENIVKGGIEVKKTVVDNDGNEIFPANETFTIRGRILDPNNEPYTWAEGDDINNTGAYHLYTLDPNGSEEAYGMKYTRTVYKGHFASTGDIEITLKAGDFIRFINLPQGSTYEFYEVTTGMPVNFELDGYTGSNFTREEPEEGESLGPFIPYDEQPQPTVTDEMVSGKVYGNVSHQLSAVNKSVKGEYFYVYHSASGQVERIYMTDSRVTKGEYNEETKTYEYTFDMAAEAGNNSSGTNTGEYYGGYYKAYGGMNGYSVNLEVNDQKIRDLIYSEANWATDTGATPYKINTAAGARKDDNLWKFTYVSSTNLAYSKTDDFGAAMTPVPGTVYYLKEVPTDYLTTYAHFVYTTKDDPKKGLNALDITQAYLITDVDDNMYRGGGFGLLIAELDDDGNVVSTTAVDGTPFTGATCQEFTLYHTKDKDSAFVDGGTISQYYDDEYTVTTNMVKSSIAPSHGLMIVNDFFSKLQKNKAYVITPFWKTPDRVVVYGTSYQIKTGDMTASSSGIQRMVDGAWTPYFTDITSGGEGEGNG